MWMGQQGGRKEAGTEIDGHLKEARALLQMFCGGRLLAEENWMI
jgi:hypothetical protein